MSEDAPAAAERAAVTGSRRGVPWFFKALFKVLSVSAAVFGSIGAFVRDVLANEVSDRISPSFLRALLDNGPVLWSILTVGLLSLAGWVVWSVLRRGPTRDPVDPAALPPRVTLVGRDDEVRQAVAGAERNEVVLIWGPSGSGTSAIAINAAQELAAEPERQRYVDLRGPDPQEAENTRRVVIRVLSVLGVRPGPSQDPERAAREIAKTLRGDGDGDDTGSAERRVLVLDNVSDYQQVEWAVRRIPGAYVIAAGDFAVPEAPGAAAGLHVGRLSVAAGLELLRRQGGGHRPQRRGVRRLWDLVDHLVPPRHHGSVATRVDAELREAERLAHRHLQLPRVAILMGQWLADNPGITVTRLLTELESGDQGAGNSELRLILRRRLDGASAGARGLFSLLAQAPITEFTEASAAAVAGGTRARTVGQLRELADRSLVRWVEPSRCQVSADARQLADPERPAAVNRSLVRLAAYYGEETDTWTEALNSRSRRAERAAEAWFGAEDVTMLELLRGMPEMPGMAEPPHRAGPHLWRIADGLEEWFRREGRLDDRRDAADGMVSAATWLGADGPQAVALLRLASVEQAAGRFATAREHLDRAERRAGRAERPQLHTGHAVRHLMVTGDRKAAEHHLDEARQTRPRRDTTGQIADLLNLAVLAEDPDRAHEYLEQGLSYLEQGLSPAEEAHCRELMGVAAWRSGDREQAEREWQKAYRQYERLGDDMGTARCLQHHGTALLTGSGTEDDRRRARKLLDSSLGLRGSDVGVGVALVHLYLGEDAAGAGRSAAAARHRVMGLTALSTWEGQSPEPDLVTRVRGRLKALPD
jgi:tetratricopeptide (TPR) repeat protein